MVVLFNRSACIRGAYLGLSCTCAAQGRGGGRSLSQQICTTPQPTVQFGTHPLLFQSTRFSATSVPPRVPTRQDLAQPHGAQCVFERTHRRFMNTRHGASSASKKHRFAQPHSPQCSLERVHCGLRAPDVAPQACPPPRPPDSSLKNHTAHCVVLSARTAAS